MILLQWFIVLIAMPWMAYSLFNPFSAFRFSRQNCGYIMPPICSVSGRNVAYTSPYTSTSAALENIENYGYYGYGYQPVFRPYAFANYGQQQPFYRGSDPSSSINSPGQYQTRPYTTTYGTYSSSYTNPSGFSHASGYYNPIANNNYIKPSATGNAYGYSRNWQTTPTKSTDSALPERQTHSSSSYKSTSTSSMSSYKA